MREVVYGEAKIEAFTRAMRQDERVLIIGGYAFNFAGLGFMHLAEPLLREFPGRVLPTPISEAAFTGAGIGAALAGARPIVTYGAASFCFAAVLHPGSSSGPAGRLSQVLFSQTKISGSFPSAPMFAVSK